MRLKAADSKRKNMFHKDDISKSSNWNAGGTGLL